MMKTFTTPNDVPDPTLFCNAWGLPGVGKSSFLLSFPPPLHVLNFDRRIEQLLTKLPKSYHGQVFYEDFVASPGEIPQDVARQYLARCETMITRAFDVGKGSFLIDGGHRWWDLVKIVKLPKAEGNEGQKGYQWPNEYARSVLLALEASPLQVGISHATSSVWDGLTRESGRVKMDAFKHIATTTTLEVYMFALGRESEVYPKEVELLTVSQPPPLSVSRHWGQIKVCKDDTSLEGQLIPNVSFRLLYNLCFNRDWDGELYEPK